MTDNLDDSVDGGLADGGVSIDEKADSLIALEDELSNLPGAAVATDEQYDSGSVVGADRVSLDACPETYPIAFDGPQLLRLDVELPSTRRTTVYLEWPDEITGETPLYRLLSAIDVPITSFADVFGEEFPLRVDGSHYVVAVPDQYPRERTTSHQETPTFEASDVSPNWLYAVLGTWLGWLAIWILASTPHVHPIFGLLGIVSWLLMPVALYFDGKHVSAVSDWLPDTQLYPLLALASVFGLVNIPLGLFYLYRRHDATFDRGANAVRFTDLLERFT